jgi:hypothetical protein
MAEVNSPSSPSGGIPMRMSTRACRARGCPDLILIPGEFGYRCRLTGLIPRNNNPAPTPTTPPPHEEIIP